MSRGNEKQNIFRDRDDRVRFLRLLDEVIALKSWELLAFCLMNNHYHLVLRTPSPTLAEGMAYLNGVYTKNSNAKYNRVGHLFQGRYFSRLIHEDRHILALTRYIAQNPLRAGLCDDIANWEWGSHRAIAGLTQCPSFLNIDFFLKLFCEDLKSARQAYINYVNVPAKAEPWMKVRSRNCTAFTSEYGDSVERLRQILRTPDDYRARNLEILDAYHNHGFSMVAIAEFLGISRERVGQMINAGR
jgi:REP element-mobilizing transposase RayT